MFQSIKERRAEKALQAKETAKLGHLSKQLQAANSVLSEKDAMIQALKADIKSINAATAEIKTNLITMQGDLVKTKNKMAESDERTTAKAIELAASAGHQPRNI